MFELYKKVNVDLSNLVGITNLSSDYEVFEESQYEHRSIINIDDNQYDLYYLSDDKLLVKFNHQYYYMKLKLEETPQSQAEYDVMIERLSQHTIDFENEDAITNFESLVDGRLDYGIEYIKESIDDDNINEESNILMNIFKSEHEYMINTIIEGVLYMYVGVPITEGQIL